MTTRKKHPNKEIEKALQYAEEHEWRIEVGGSHAWGKIYCSQNDKKRVVDNCTSVESIRH